MLVTKLGMVMDFGDLKRIVDETVVARLDHAFVMRRTERSEALHATIAGEFRNIVLVDYQPTCENMLVDFAERLRNALPDGVRLHSLKLYETAKSFAEWVAEEQ